MQKEKVIDIFDRTLNSLNLDTFLRHLLFKTAKRQFKKSRLNDAIETFFQLVVVCFHKNGRLY